MQRIKKVVDRHNIILRTGTNFIDPVGISVDFMPWFRQLGIECDISTCVGSTGVTRLQAVEKFVQDKTTYIQWFNDLVDQSIYTDKVCSSEKLLTDISWCSSLNVIYKYFINDAYAASCRFIVAAYFGHRPCNVRAIT